MQTWRLCLTEVAFLPPAKTAAESMTRRPESLVCRLLAREGEPYRHISGYRLVADGFHTETPRSVSDARIMGLSPLVGICQAGKILPGISFGYIFLSFGEVFSAHMEIGGS